MKITVIGGGLAGCEAAWQAAQAGAEVELWEMKPLKFSPAHSNPNLGELVCSNSLKAMREESASGLLKKEMQVFGSLIIECAYKAQVPAGGALAVDRERFSEEVTRKIRSHPKIKIINAQIEKIPDRGKVIVAPGPLVEGELAGDISRISGGYLNFYDAAAPIVATSSIDMDRSFFGARYNRGGDDYINCPMTKEQYEAFYEELINAETAVKHEDIDRPEVFEGCMPVEVMARRGRETLLFGPLKPVGLYDPETDKRPFAVVQLRQDNMEKTLFNIVGFQTNLKWGEQKRVFSMIPALENAEFVRYGVMHKNCFIDAPRLLNADFSMRENPDIYIAGQLSGVEGYVESAASGLIAGRSAAGQRLNLPPLCMMGAISGYISGGSVGEFQPINANFGILPPLEERIRDKKQRYAKLASRALENLNN